MTFKIDEKEVDALWVLTNQSAQTLRAFWETADMDDKNLVTLRSELGTLHRVWDLMDRHISTRKVTMENNKPESDHREKITYDDFNVDWDAIKSINIAKAPTYLEEAAKKMMDIKPEDFSPDVFDPEDYTKFYIDRGIDVHEPFKKAWDYPWIDEQNFPTNPPGGLISSTAKGWECPKCEAVYAPFVRSCGNCIPAPKVTHTTGSTS